MEKSKSMVWRTLLVLFIAFLWGGGLSAYAEKKAWAKFDNGTLTFRYGEKSSLDTDEYWLNEGNVSPEWYKKQADVTKVVFEKSFAVARPTSCYGWFNRCLNLLEIEGIENLNTSNVTNMAYMFFGCSKLTSLDVSNFDTSNVTDMSDMFEFCDGLTSLDVSKFDTSNVKDMYYMFSSCSKLTSLDVSNFNTSKVTDMSGMFRSCSNLTSLDVSNFDTSNVKSMEAMFDSCSALTSLNLSNFDTSNVTSMSHMFAFSALTSLDLSNFDTSNVTSMMAMFYGCSQLHTIYVSSNFVMTKVSSSKGMFIGCKNLQGDIAYDDSYTDKTYAKLEGGYFSDKDNLKPWVKYADGTFTFYYRYKSIFADGEFALNDAESLPAWSDDDFDKSGITKVVFDESFADVRPTSCASWFANFTGLQTVEGWEYLNTSEVTNMNSMFLNCKSLRSLDLSTFDTQQVRDMRRMFEGCTKMETLDLMSFNTQKIYYISFMFYGDGKLKTIYASDKFSLSHLADNKYMNFQNIFTDCVSLAGEVRYNPKWDTGRSFAKTEYGYFLDKQYVRPWVGFADGTLTFNYSYKRLLSYQENYVPYTSGQQWKPGWISDHGTEIKKVVFDKAFAEARPTYCYGWFSGCENLTEIVGIMYLNTSDVYDMGSMFEGCTALTSLDLSHFDTQKVTEMTKMFSGCSNLAAIYASDKFVLSAVTSDADMFAGCEKLKGDIAFDANSVDKTYAKNQDGYFLNGGSLRPWAEYDGGVLTFYYGYKPELGTDEYEMNAGTYSPNWIDNHKADITKIVFDKSFADARPTTCAKWFYSCENLATIEGMEYLNTSEVTNMYGMFYMCSPLTTLDLSHFDTSNVTDMNRIFYGCSSLETLDLSNFNTGKLTNMQYMFGVCRSLTSLKLSNFDTQNVTDMSSMFYSCETLAILDLSNFDTENVSDMFSMFESCYSLTSLDLSGFNTHNVSDMTFMFKDCSNLQTIYANESFVVKESAYDRDMFYHCYNLYGDIAFDANYRNKTYAKLEGGYFTHKEYTRPWVSYADGTLTFRYGYKKELNDYQDEYPVETDDWFPKWVYTHTSYSGGNDDITKAVFDKSFAHYLPTKTDNWLYNCKNMESVEGIENVNTSRLTSIYQMFAGCSSLKSLDLSSFNTENVENLSGLFQDCSSLETIDLKNFNTQKVSSIYGMFSGCSALKSLDLKNFDTKNVESMSMMFYNCSNLTNLDLGSFDTQKVTDMSSMFSGCSSLKTIDLKNFDTKAVTNMGYMFWRCANLTDLDVSGFDTQLVTDMSAMFSGCSSLKTLDVSKFVTKQVYGMKEMFKGCASLENLDLSNFNPERLGEIKEMFAGCSKLTTLDLSKLNVDGVYETSKMFKDCASLATLTLPSFENAYMGATDEMFAGCSELTYLDLTTLKTDNVYDMSKMFAGCSNLSTICASAGFVPSEYVTDTEMFDSCVKLQGDIAFDANYIDKTYAKLEGGYFADKAYVRPWVKFADGTLTFRYGYKKTIDQDAKEYELNVRAPGWLDYSNEIKNAVFDKTFAVARPTTCQEWFKQCSNLAEIVGIEYLNTSKVTNMSHMFFGCSQLSSLDVSKFDTKNVVYMLYMFYQCSKLNSLDVSNFNTRNVTNMYYMFNNCINISFIDVSNFDTQKVVDMGCMFYNCSKLTFLDLSNFNCSSATNIAEMFGATPSLKSIYFGDGFKADKLESIPHDHLFYNCPATLYCSPKQYDSFKNNSVIASYGNAVKPYVGINQKSQYGTLCVPVGSSLAAGSFTGFDKLYQVQNADKDKGTITMVEAKRIEPGVPYVYHRYLEGVDFEGKNDMSVITFDVDENASSAVTAPKNEGSLLKGTFESMVALGGSYILQTDGNFHPVAADNKTLKVGAYRAYLDLNSVGEGGAEIGAKAYQMVFEDGEATGIDRINGEGFEGSDKGVYDQADSQPKVYFDLMGRKVVAPQNGEIYIVNGKKVVYNK